MEETRPGTEIQDFVLVGQRQNIHQASYSVRCDDQKMKIETKNDRPGQAGEQY